MNSPQEPAKEANPASPLPTGESHTGVVRKAASTPENTPVLEHSAAVAEPAPPAEPAAVDTSETAPAPAPVASPAPVAPPAVAQAVVRPALQEIPKVPIPVRMNQLQSDQQRLREELEALENALKSPPL